MVYLFLGIFANALIFLAFRAFPIFKIHNLQAIVVNYVVCVITGIMYTGSPSVLFSVDYASPTGLIAAVMGILFIAGFYSASLTSQLIGVSVTSVASKMSLVIPVLFSLFFMKIESKDFSFLNYAGIILAVVSIYLASIRKGSTKKSTSKLGYFLLLPFAVFVFGGAIDTLINYSNHVYLTTENQESFPIILFAFAAVIGIIILLLQRKKLEIKNLIGGICLGIPNFFALLFIFKALSVFENNGAVFFPIYNVGIIIASTLGAMIIFKEKLNKINYLGLTLSMIALYLLSYQEMIEYFSS